jgi:hypothetical protein
MITVIVYKTNLVGFVDFFCFTTDYSDNKRACLPRVMTVSHIFDFYRLYFLTQFKPEYT